jgi:hypothetical protein
LGNEEKLSSSRLPKDRPIDSKKALLFEKKAAPARREAKTFDSVEPIGAQGRKWSSMPFS